MPRCTWARRWRCSPGCSASRCCGGTAGPARRQAAIPLPDKIAAAVARYAQRLHAVAGESHHVASPLGAWLLLALAAPAARGADRHTITGALGCDAGQAAATAARLLARPHPQVAAAAAVWTAPEFTPPASYESWQASLPAAVAAGPLPGQAGVDAWARERTFGLIDALPVDVSEAAVVLASALATRVSWRLPFQLAPAADLGPASPWAGQLRQVLRTPAGPGSYGHEAFIADGGGSGDVIVHAASAAGGLLVVSVAAEPGRPAGAVLAAAHEIATGLAAGQPPRRDLHSLPLGSTPLWTISEETATADTTAAVLPAWSASSQLDLAGPELGFAAAGQALVPAGLPCKAEQAAVARYSRTGFEAAAVTGVAIPAAAILPARHRRAELRFASPYAVVAVAVADGSDGGAGEDWAGLPVFSAWVAQPQDAADR